MSNPDEHSVSSGKAKFDTTHWSLVLSAGRQSSPTSRSALATLCQQYWQPLYAYVRRRTADVHEAQDLTQEFFTRLIERNIIEVADPTRGRFRSFLLTSLQHFLANQWKKAATEKRGGGQVILSLDFSSLETRYSFEPAAVDNPEREFERDWAITLLDSVLGRLRQEFVDANKQTHFEHLKRFLSGAEKLRSYQESAEVLSMSEGAVRTAVHRLRKRYRELLRDEIAQSVACPEDIEEELRELFAALGS